VSLTYLVFNNRLSSSRGDFRPGYKNAETPMAISSAIEIALIAPAAIVAITFHEAAHGYVARYFGDDTVMLQGRLTLNPLKHIDPVGTILLPAMLTLLNTGFIFG
jgi:Zn-dependent protease